MKEDLMTELFAILALALCCGLPLLLVLLFGRRRGGGPKDWR
jgi:thiol:disulfide interchange protein